MAKLELVEYDPGWTDRYQAEAALIREALGDRVRKIEHVGSTAVTGLAGKPTIDIAVGVDSIDLPVELIEHMRAAGFRYEVDEQRPWEKRFVRGAEVPREVIVHVVEWQGTKWSEFLRFRDALRADAGLAAEYEQLKRSLLGRGRWYRGKDKQELIEDVLARTAEEVESSSPEETERIAGDLAADLRPGDVVTVSGELGSGKTTFVRGACRALGVRGPVTSPTYTIGHRYRGDVDVSHLDLYRFAAVSPAEWGDLEPYFDGAICFVEWPEAARDSLPGPRARVLMRHAGGDRRMIRVERADPGV
jgi:tRNA threonylcarbamoyladenosine biosynthesis protein TsaE